MWCQSWILRNFLAKKSANSRALHLSQSQMFHLLFPLVSSHLCKVKWFILPCFGLIAFTFQSITKTNGSQKQKGIQESFLKNTRILGFCIKLSTENETSKQRLSKSKIFFFFTNSNVTNIVLTCQTISCSCFNLLYHHCFTLTKWCNKNVVWKTLLKLSTSFSY